MIIDDIRSCKFRDFFEHYVSIGKGVLSLVVPEPSAWVECEGKKFFFLKRYRLPEKFLIARNSSFFGFEILR